ncbi:hypothetical protein [Halobaculum sp. P14]|uniref:hypothetical protein n=1 Tax=Halobaculum sp. P14 TaxID=3421638 RepID=UPI003EBCAB37
MTRGRRSVLRGVAVGAGTLLGGCVASGSNVRYPDSAAGATDGDARTGAGDSTAGADGAEADRKQPPAEANPALGARTRLVVDELAWFATQYPAAVETYMAALNRAVEATRTLADAGNVTVADVDRLAADWSNAVEVTRGAFGNHYPIAGFLRDRSTYHLDVIRKFARRDDRDRVREELRRLASFGAGAASEPFIEGKFPRNPIQNRLVERLRNDPRDVDGDGTIDWRLVTQLLYEPAEGSPFQAYAYDDTRRSLFQPPLPADSRAEIRDSYAPLYVGENRVSVVTAAFHEVGPSLTTPQFPRNRPTASVPRTVVAQRYTDERAAADALSLALGDVTQEGTYRFPDSTWRRVYYRRGGDVVYAFCCRAGEFVLATGAERTAWEERVDWNRKHRRTWLAGE